MLEFLFIVMLCAFSLSGYAAWGYVQKVRKELAEAVAEQQAIIERQKVRLVILENCLTCCQENYHDLNMKHEQLLMVSQGLGPVERTWHEDMDKPTTAD